MNKLTSLLIEAVFPRIWSRNVKQFYDKYVEVESSNIHSVLYHQDRNLSKRHMRVRFLNGAEYMYYGVPQRIFVMLLNAPSHGKQFWKTIRNTYRYERLANWM
jgi:hypothetical protein